MKRIFDQLVRYAAAAAKSALRSSRDWLKERGIAQRFIRYSPLFQKLTAWLSWGRIRLIAVLVTIVLVLLVQVVPPQTRALHGNPNYRYSLSMDHRADGAKATWLDDYSRSRFKCDIGNGESAWCGYTMAWPQFNDGLMDFTRYHSVRIKLKYVGTAKRLRVYMRVYHPDYGSLAETHVNKFQSVTLEVDEFDRQSVSIPFREFVVSDWWVQRYSIERQHATPSFEGVQLIAIDYPQPGARGEHVMEVQSVELVGDYITREGAYLALLAFWMLVVVGEGVVRYYLLNIKAQKAQAKALNLANYAREMRAQTSLYKKLSGVDPLTGAYNRSGLKPLLTKSFSRDRRTGSGVLMVIDIDHFKVINDTFGHSAGDSVIKRVAHAVSGAIRVGDLFARWGGEEFLLLCPDVDRATGRLIGEKLRSTVAALDFNGELSVTISIGVTDITMHDAFEQCFERADKALYQAKRQGRNRVVFESYPVEDLAYD